MKRYRYIPFLSMLLLCAGQTSAQERDTTTQFNALDHVLQAPPVAKRYDNKKFGDRLFIEAGAGVDNLFLRSSKTYVDWGHFGYNGNISIGDWLTPEHGLRLSVGGRLLRRSGIPNHIKAYGVSLDYLMNITAIGSRKYDAPKRFELIGTAGIDVLKSRFKGKSEWVPAVHVGLRGQANVSSYAYLYVEPRFTAYHENLLHRSNQYGWRPSASITAGAGYHLNPSAPVSNHTFETTGQLLDNTFFSFSAGPAALIASQQSIWKDQIGARAFASIGKWFAPYSGVRLSLSLIEYAYNSKARHKKGHVKGIAISADYLLNLNNVFGGYNPDRRFFVNGLAGASINYVQTGSGKKWIPGIGLGLQPNLRVGTFTTLFIEPRLDFYPKRFATYAYSCKQADIAASLLAGITIGQSADMHNTQTRNASFTNRTWYDNAFIEVGAGGMILMRNYTLHHPKSTLSPALHIGMGKWFTPISGARLRAEAGHLEWKGGSRSFLNFGADYMWNIANSTTGYMPNRHFELVGIAGLDLAAHRNAGKVYFGANAGLKGIWNATRTVSLYIEPSLYAYDNAFLPGTTATSIKIDLFARLTAGLQFNLRAAETEALNRYEQEDVRAFYSVSAGPAATANSISKLRHFGGLGRIGYGRWFTPLWAWRITMGVDALRHKGRIVHYSGRWFIGGDYLFDITNATLGEDEKRVLNLRALAGVNLGMRYERQKTRFCPDMHIGMQLAARLGHGWEIYAEPMLLYLSHSKNHDKAEHMMPTLQLGLNYEFRMGDRTPAERASKQFAEVAIGLGAWSATVAKAHPFGRKLSFAYSVAYGRYINEYGAVRLGVARTHIHKRTARAKGSDLNTFHIDYLYSLLPQDNGKFHLRAVAGVNVDAMEYTSKTRWGFGLNLGVQAAYDITELFEIFAEPTVTILSKSLTPNTKHPVEGEGKVYLGTRFNF